MRTSLSALLLLLLCLKALAAALPPEVASALARFRSDGPTGWSYVQYSKGRDQSRLESFNPAAPLPSRWRLLSENEQDVSEATAADYARSKTQRSSPYDAPRLENRIDLDSGRVLSETADELRIRFELKGESSGEPLYLHAEYTIDRKVPCVRRVEIRNEAPYSPVFGVSIKESHTTLEYGPPEGSRPGLLLRAAIRLRGRAFLLRSLDDDLVIEWREHAPAGPGAQRP